MTTIPFLSSRSSPQQISIGWKKCWSSLRWQTVHIPPPQALSPCAPRISCRNGCPACPKLIQTHRRLPAVQRQVFQRRKLLPLEVSRQEFRRQKLLPLELSSQEFRRQKPRPRLPSRTNL